MDLPIVAWIAIICIGMAIGIVVIIKLREHGARYGLSFFLSLPFWLMFAATNSTYWAVFLTAQEAAARYENAVWGGAFTLAAFALSIFLNARKSNLMFGFVFSLGQLVVAALSALVLMLLLLRFSGKQRTA